MAEADSKPADVSVTVEKKGMSTMQWIAVLGVGTVLLPGIVAWMMNWMNSQTKFMQTTIQQNTTAISANTEQAKDVESVLRSTKNALVKLGDKIDQDPDQ